MPTASTKFFEAQIFGGKDERIGTHAQREKLQRERDLRAAAETTCSAGPLCAAVGAAVDAVTSDASSGSAAGEDSDTPLAGAGTSTASAASAPGPLRKCACQHAQYCSTGCQKAHWKLHKDVCVTKRKQMADEAEEAKATKAKADARSKAAVEALLMEER